MKADGSVKLRAVDHLSWSAPVECGKEYVSRKRQRERSINGCTALPEEIHLDHLDALAATMRAFKEIFKMPPALWKGDVDSAFRRIPLRPDHRWAAAVAYMVQGQVCTPPSNSHLFCTKYACMLQAYVSVHNACPFGSCSAVYNWERVGAMLATLARRVFKLAVLRYVDDCFGLERCICYVCF